MGKTATVKFDVGGTLHKISKSLLEQHPDTIMAKMASERWNDTDGSDEEFFIQGNGERFQYVVDYMQRGKVSLPVGRVSKEAFIEDLEYYGFESISNVTHVGLLEACNATVCFTDDHERMVKQVFEHYTSNCVEVAGACFLNMESNGIEGQYHATFSFSSRKNADTDDTAKLARHLAQRKDFKTLDACLAPFGIRCESMHLIGLRSCEYGLVKLDDVEM